MTKHAPEPSGGTPLPIWVVYDHPNDFPYSYVARLHIGARATADFMCAPNLDELRAWLSGLGLYRLPRFAQDDPKIVETWL